MAAGGRRSPAAQSPGTAHPSMADMLADGAPAVRQGLRRRIGTVLGALGQLPPPGDDRLVVALTAALEPVGRPGIWLALAVLTGQLPDSATVISTSRRAQLDGVLPALEETMAAVGPSAPEHWHEVEVVTGQVVVDVHHTSETEFATGIQRVVRAVASRWNRDHEPLLAGWTEHYGGLRRLTADEQRRALWGPETVTPAGEGGRRPPPPPATAVPDQPPATIVPWRCTVLVPELAAEPDRGRRYQALASFSGSTTGIIGYDCVPVMASETSAEGMAAAFSMHLAAVAHMDRVAAISDAAASEFSAWRSMLAGSGRTGPDVRAVPLTVEAMVPTEAAMQAARELLCIGPLPVVLAVGSHEPRKNHLAVLHAANVLWRDGVEFSLTFVGGHSWKSEIFSAQVQALQGEHRPVQTLRALSDELLWAAYRVAYCTVFMSVHEGFGLPVAESLASGTPVVASNVGSMLELAGRGGSIVADPADDDAIAVALRRILRQPALRQRLAEEAAALQWRSWDDYAGEVWRFLVDGTSP